MRVVYVADGAVQHMAVGPEDVSISVPYLLPGTATFCGIPVDETPHPVLGFPSPTDDNPVCVPCLAGLHAAR